ncbi:MAG: sugar phosphate nucleotidyltransferase [Nitrososphaeria archaeon]
MMYKAVITAAGLGTRLLSVTKELPKEMLPLFCRENEKIMVKPLLQLVFEQLYEIGIRDFCFVIGKGKRSIEDHFTIDNRFVSDLKAKGKENEARILERFYNMLSQANISYVTQDEPNGFGDAVLRAKHCVNESRFVVAAGDTYILSKNHNHLRQLLELGLKIDAVLMLKRVNNPSAYGVAVIKNKKVIKVVEKPQEKIGNLAIMPFYSFTPEIFDHLKSIKPGYGGEVQLTDAIESMIESGKNVGYVLLNKVNWMDIGSPNSYWKALLASYKLVKA